MYALYIHLDVYKCTVHIVENNYLQLCICSRTYKLWWLHGILKEMNHYQYAIKNILMPWGKQDNYTQMEVEDDKYKTVLLFLLNLSE